MDIILCLTARHPLLDHHHPLQPVKHLLHKDFRDFPLPLMVPPEVVMLALIIGQLASLLSSALLHRCVGASRRPQAFHAAERALRFVLYLFVVDVSKVEEFDQTVGHSKKVVQCEDHHTVVIHDVFFLVNKVGNHLVLQIV